MFDLQVTQCSLPSFESVGLLVQEKKRKTNFQEAAIFDFLNRKDFSLFSFNYKSRRCFLLSFKSGEEAKNRFLGWPPRQPSWISRQNDFMYFWSTSHPMLPTKFQDNWHFSSGEEAENRLSRWPPCGHLKFPIKTILAFFYLLINPMLPT